MEDNNNIERFFNQKFNQNIDPEDWNTPEDEVWENIYSNLNSENKKKRYLWIIPCLSLLFLSSIVLGYTLWQKQNELEKLRSELLLCSESSNNKSDLGKTPFRYPGNTKPEVKGESTPDANASKKISHDTKNRVRQNIYKWDKINKMTDPNISAISGKFEINVNLSEITADEPLHSLAKEIKVMNEIPSLAQKTIEPLIVERSIPLVYPNPRIKIEPNKINRDWIGISSGFYIWNDLKKGTFENVLSELLINEETKPTVSLGVSGMKQLNSRFAIQAGIYYYKRSQKSFYELNLPYSTTSETVAGTDKLKNTFEHSLPTALGEINTNLILTRKVDSPVENNENVYLDFSFENQSSALNVPLMLSYYPKEVGKGLFINAGVQTEWIIKNNIKNIEANSHHTFVKEETVNVGYKASQINRLNFSAVIGAGYQIPIIKGIDLVVQGSYGKALNNTYSTATYKHKIDSYNTQISILHRL